MTKRIEQKELEQSIMSSKLYLDSVEAKYHARLRSHVEKYKLGRLSLSEYDEILSSLGGFENPEIGNMLTKDDASLLGLQYYFDLDSDRRKDVIRGKYLTQEAKRECKENELISKMYRQRTHQVFVENRTRVEGGLSTPMMLESLGIGLKSSTVPDSSSNNALNPNNVNPEQLMVSMAQGAASGKSMGLVEFISSNYKIIIDGVCKMKIPTNVRDTIDSVLQVEGATSQTLLGSEDLINPTPADLLFSKLLGMDSVDSNSYSGVRRYREAVKELTTSVSESSLMSKMDSRVNILEDLHNLLIGESYDDGSLIPSELYKMVTSRIRKFNSLAKIPIPASNLNLRNYVEAKILTSAPSATAEETRSITGKWNEYLDEQERGVGAIRDQYEELRIPPRLDPLFDLTLEIISTFPSNSESLLSYQPDGCDIGVRDISSSEFRQHVVDHLNRKNGRSSDSVVKNEKGVKLTNGDKGTKADPSKGYEFDSNFCKPLWRGIDPISALVNGYNLLGGIRDYIVESSGASTLQLDDISKSRVEYLRYLEKVYYNLSLTCVFPTTVDIDSSFYLLSTILGMPSNILGRFHSSASKGKGLSFNNDVIMNTLIVLTTSARLKMNTNLDQVILPVDAGMNGKLGKGGVVSRAALVIDEQLGSVEVFNLRHDDYVNLCLLIPEFNIITASREECKQVSELVTSKIFNWINPESSAIEKGESPEDVAMHYPTVLNYGVGDYQSTLDRGSRLYIILYRIMGGREELSKLSSVELQEKFSGMSEKEKHDISNAGGNLVKYLYSFYVGMIYGDDIRLTDEEREELGLGKLIALYEDLSEKSEDDELDDEEKEMLARMSKSFDLYQEIMEYFKVSILASEMGTTYNSQPPISLEDQKKIWGTNPTLPDDDPKNNNLLIVRDLAKHLSIKKKTKLESHDVFMKLVKANSTCYGKVRNIVHLDATCYLYAGAGRGLSLAGSKLIEKYLGDLSNLSGEGADLEAIRVSKVLLVLSHNETSNVIRSEITKAFKMHSSGDIDIENLHRRVSSTVSNCKIVSEPDFAVQSKMYRSVYSGGNLGWDDSAINPVLINHTVLKIGGPRFVSEEMKIFPCDPWKFGSAEDSEMSGNFDSIFQDGDGGKFSLGERYDSENVKDLITNRKVKRSKVINDLDRICGEWTLPQMKFTEDPENADILTAYKSILALSGILSKLYKHDKEEHGEFDGEVRIPASFVGAKFYYEELTGSRYDRLSQMYGLGKFLNDDFKSRICYLKMVQFNRITGTIRLIDTGSIQEGETEMLDVNGLEVSVSNPEITIQPALLIMENHSIGNSKVEMSFIIPRRWGSHTIQELMEEKRKGELHEPKPDGDKSKKFRVNSKVAIRIRKDFMNLVESMQSPKCNFGYRIQKYKFDTRNDKVVEELLSYIVESNSSSDDFSLAKIRKVNVFITQSSNFHARSEYDYESSWNLGSMKSALKDGEYTSPESASYRFGIVKRAKTNPEIILNKFRYRIRHELRALESEWKSGAISEGDIIPDSFSIDDYESYESEERKSLRRKILICREVMQDESKYVRVPHYDSASNRGTSNLKDGVATFLVGEHYTTEESIIEDKIDNSLNYDSGLRLIATMIQAVYRSNARDGDTEMGVPTCLYLFGVSNEISSRLLNYLDYRDGHSKEHINKPLRIFDKYLVNYLDNIGGNNEVSKYILESMSRGLGSPNDYEGSMEEMKISETLHSGRRRRHSERVYQDFVILCLLFPVIPIVLSRSGIEVYHLEVEALSVSLEDMNILTELVKRVNSTMTSRSYPELSSKVVFKLAFVTTSESGSHKVFEKMNPHCRSVRMFIESRIGIAFDTFKGNKRINRKENDARSRFFNLEEYSTLISSLSPHMVWTVNDLDMIKTAIIEGVDSRVEV